jgi:hypothetical protein
MYKTTLNFEIKSTKEDAKKRVVDNVPTKKLTWSELASRKVEPKIEKKWHVLPKGILSIIQYIFITVITIISAYSTDLGQLFILIFAVYSIVFRKDSKTTFAIALFLLITIPFFQVINQEGIAENFAIYVFNLLVLGTFQSILEIFLEKMFEKKGKRNVY